MKTAYAGARFRRIAAAGIFFQGGAAAIDTGTIVAALVHLLTGSAVAVGAAAAIARSGWLFPQLFVAYHARYRRRRLPYYVVGSLGRVACLASSRTPSVKVAPEATRGRSSKALSFLQVCSATHSIFQITARAPSTRL
jgi:hypothetical protein